MAESDAGYGGISDETWEELHERAVEAKANAYAPYSDFDVGAALLTESGDIFIGANVEQASIGGTVCAERTAVVSAVTHGHRSFKAICVVTDSAEPTAPCGFCRQTLGEFGLELPILMASSNGEREFTTLREIFPRAFVRIEDD